MNTKERLLRRLWAIDNFALIMRELEFHREHKLEEELEGYMLWRLDTPIGQTQFP